MNLISAGITSAILAAGVVGSVAAYRNQAAPASEVVPVRPAAQRTVVQWAPCQPPSRLENGVCVTDVVRTVVRPAPDSSPTTSTSATGNEIQQPADVGDDDQTGDDVGGVESEDQADERDDADELGWGYTDAEEREDDD
jgi:hypothetical protein